MKLVIFVLTIANILANLKAQTPCESSPCRAPSECENLGQDYVCHCKPGIKGQKCDRPMLTGDSLCLSNPCWNSGVCTANATDFKCQCPDGFSGANCRVMQSSACLTNNPCKNSGKCQVVNQNGNTATVCFCVGDWTGKFCETKIGLCEKPNPCYNGGTCYFNSCRCPQNFTGNQCETYNPQSTDRILKVLNKGFFVLKLSLSYEVANGTQKDIVTQTGQILLGQQKEFRIPNSVNYIGDYGVTLTLDVVLSFKKINIRINSSPECIHIWGAFFAPKWSKIDC